MSAVAPFPTRGTRRLLAALAAAYALGATREAAAMNVQWGNIQYAGDYDAINFVIQNDNPGTTYSSLTLTSGVPFFGALFAANRAYWPTLSAMMAGWTGGLPNFNIGISTEAGLVNDGWAWSLGADGVIELRPEGGPMDDTFAYGCIFSGTLYVNRALLGPGGSLGVVTNAAGAADTAVSGAGTDYNATPAWVPGYAPGATGLAVRAAGVAVRGVTNVVRLAAETAGRRQFRVQFADAPGVTNWADLRVCASTGAVTEVWETNTVPTRFYRVVSP